jgi:hypothetical protein
MFHVCMDLTAAHALWSTRDDENGAPLPADPGPEDGFR